MNTPTRPQTYREFALEVAAEFGERLTDEQIDYVLWNWTGFPSFFAPRKGETHLDVLRRQLAEYFTVDWLLNSWPAVAHAYERQPRLAARSLCGRRATWEPIWDSMAQQCKTCHRIVESRAVAVGGGCND